MTNIRAVLFDADGVLTLPEEMFSVLYTRSHGLDPKPFEQFFTEQWDEIVTGKKDLKVAIEQNAQMWQWGGTTDDLLDYWFKSEDLRNQEMLDLVNVIRSQGTPCYLATDQETHRGNYMRDVMFKDLFDDYFISAEIGIKKSNPAFFSVIIEKLQHEIPGLLPAEVVFFDDSQSKVDAALVVGIDAQLFTGVEQVKEYIL